MSFNLEHRLVDPWVIEKLKEERRREEQQPSIPINDPSYDPLPEKKEKKPDRGVYRINIGGDEDPDADDLAKTFKDNVILLYHEN